MDETKSLPEPYRASHDKQPSDHAPGDGHGIHYDEHVRMVSWAGFRIRAT